ncbi:MAG: MgtC/SapB family protein [bacterium]
MEPSLIESVVRLSTAIACGGLLGVEREWTRHDAGIRTNTLVAFGAGLFGMVSVFGFGPGHDPGRVAAQVVTGIGFLGAGIIMQRQRHITGLTTAATLWVSAGVGLAAGVGLLHLAWTAAVLALLGQIILRQFELLWINPRRPGVRTYRYRIAIENISLGEPQLVECLEPLLRHEEGHLLGAIPMDGCVGVELIWETEGRKGFETLMARLHLYGLQETEAEEISVKPSAKKAPS